MQVSSLARDIASVFYEVCVEDNIVDEILYESKSIQQIHTSDIRTILSIPIISREIKRDLILSLEEVGYKKQLINLLQVLLDGDQLSYFDQIMSAFMQIYQEENDILLVEVTSATKLSSDSVDLIRRNMEESLDKFIIVLTTIDSSVIGGIKISYDGKIVDNTIASQLKKLKELKVS